MLGMMILNYVKVANNVCIQRKIQSYSYVLIAAILF
jgi:hypothetical protein